jgi:hypothetical protein
VTEHCIRVSVGWTHCGGGRRDQRNPNIAREKTSDEIVDVPLEAAETMERIHGPGDDGHTQRLTFRPSHADADAAR